MEWKRDENLEMAKNKKAERSRNHFETVSTYSDFDHSNKMVTQTRGGVAPYLVYFNFSRFHDKGQIMKEIKSNKTIKGIKFKIDLDLRPRVFILATIETAILIVIIKLIMR